MKSLTPSTNIDILRHQTDALSMYPHKALVLGLDSASGSTFEIIPLPNRFQNDDYVVWINNVIYENILGSSNTVVDLTNTGIDGLVDGITFTAADSSPFLIWAFANNSNNGFTGFAVTHKPYSACSGPASIAKGATVSITGLTNAYQFTVGARVAVNRTSGATNEQDIEYNWGVVDSIVSSASIQVTMDLDSNYGVALTAAPNEVMQWNKFRPWVVASSSQALYTDNYRLVGELQTDSSGNVNQVNRVDDEWRLTPFTSNYRNTTVNLSAIGAHNVGLGRHIPLWANRVSWMSQYKVTVATSSQSYQIGASVVGGDSAMQFNSLVANLTTRTNGTTGINAYATAEYLSTVTTNSSWRTWITGYRVPGGMRE